MRLIRTSPPFELGEFFENQILNLEYAILSHRWEEEELSFQEMIAPTEQIRQKKGYQKVKHFCERARADGFEYVWVDTCCINKESSAELSESINSMFRWYLNATKCYAYMLDVSMIETDCLDQLLTSVWFTRGWTLQELVAPQEMVFLANDWSEIGSRRELASRIEQITNIDTALLLGKTKLYNYCISKRMSWAATRETTRTEDRAYCLMGIFNVNMPLLYGEGENAFIRLQEEIMKDSNDETLFAWERNGISEEKPCGLLAPSPDCFAESGDIVPYPLSENGLPFGSTNRGIRMQSPLVPPVSSTTTLILQCVGSSKLVGVGIMTSPSSPDYVRITSNLLRDIPYSVLLGAVLDTAYIPKSLFLASTNNSALQAQASDSEANSSSQIADHLLNRRIQPRGHCKNLVLCFDDTTSPYTADGNASNVAKLHRMLDRSEGNQVAFYQTWGRGTTLESVTKDAYRFIMEYYQREDEISLVGFSRGCHAAQTLDEFMDHFGILFSSHEKMIDEAWSTFLTFKSQEGRAKQYAHLKLQYFRESFCRPRRRISFVGLFDAVDPDAQNNRHSTSYMVFSSQFVCHALAIDERQASLRPTLAKKYTKYTSYSQYFEQVWFPGAHEDLGGIMQRNCDEIIPLSHLSLVWMVNNAKRAGLRFDRKQETSRKTSTVEEDLDLISGDYRKAKSETDDASLSILHKDFITALNNACEEGFLHNELEFGRGWAPVHVCKQRVRDLFYSRTLSQSAALKRNLRKIPLDANVHSSVLRRMRADSTYRPMNLCIENPDCLTILNMGDRVMECFVRATAK